MNLKKSSFTEEDLSDVDKVVLRYVTGATIHHVTMKLKKSVENKILSNANQARCDYRVHQLIQCLRTPEQFIINNSEELESLLEVI